MSTERPMGPPTRLLLSTDLDARSDRALERAVQLAGEWDAELVALHVLEPTASEDLATLWVERKDEEVLAIARDQLADALAGYDVRSRAVVEDTRNVAATVRAVAQAQGCEVIVTGMSRSESLGHALLGDTVESLAHTVAQPLLVVRNRVRGPYARMLLTTDFSESSRHALQVALRCFPGRDLVLYHGTGMQPPTPQDAVRRAAEIEDGACAEFIAGCDLPEDVRARMTVVIRHGPVEATLADYVRRVRMDVAVLGTHGQSRVWTALLGSTASRLLRWLPCDVLLVREPRAIT